MRQLTVTADDFGLSPEVNEAVIETHRLGIVTAASLMVAGDAAAHAVELARRTPSLAVGLHLVAADGRATLPVPDIPHLVDREGRFAKSPFRAGLRYAFSRVAREELRREIVAQLEAFRRTGLALAHVDGHHHLHVHPVILSILAELAPDYGIPAVRLPSEELATALALDRKDAARNTLWRAVFSALSVQARWRLARSGVRFADRVYGLFATGRIDEDYLLRLVPRMRGRRVELYAHPSAARSGSGRHERDALSSPRVRDAIRAAGFALGPLS